MRNSCGTIEILPLTEPPSAAVQAAHHEPFLKCFDSEGGERGRVSNPMEGNLKMLGWLPGRIDG